MESGVEITFLYLEACNLLRFGGALWEIWQGELLIV